MGRSEQLESESERRAKVFNNAVKQAVQRFQGQLESERDELVTRCEQLTMVVGVAERAAVLAAEREAAVGRSRLTLWNPR